VDVCCFGYIPVKSWYYDYQLSKAQQSLGDKVIDLKLWCCYGQLSLFPMATVSLPAIWHTFLPMTSKTDKLPLETEPVARGNFTI